MSSAHRERQPVRKRARDFLQRVTGRGGRSVLTPDTRPEPAIPSLTPDAEQPNERESDPQGRYNTASQLINEGREALGKNPRFREAEERRRRRSLGARATLSDPAKWEQGGNEFEVVDDTVIDLDILGIAMISTDKGQKMKEDLYVRAAIGRPLTIGTPAGSNDGFYSYERQGGDYVSDLMAINTPLAVQKASRIFGLLQEE